MTANVPDADRRSLVLRLRRIEGQLRGIQSMVETGSDCEQIAQQMAAARKALDRAFFATIACAIRCEIGASGVKREDARKRLTEMTELLARFA